MAVRELLESILDNGIHNTNYFNGRLLSAEDLRTDQDANRLQRQQLGRAIGDGIAYGFEVRESLASPPAGLSVPVLSVSSGLAINRCGQALSLASDIDLALIRERDATAVEAGLFAPCIAQASDELSATGSGVYILVASPAAEFDGLAPSSGLGGNGNRTGSCGRAFAVEGVQFKLVGLTGASAVVQGVSGTGEAALSKIRNLLAHFCFGTEEVRECPKDPFRLVNAKPAFAAYGAIDATRLAKDLADCDVPLALVYWKTAGLQFIDMWAVRRRITSRSVNDMWNVILGDRRAGEAEAMFMQFQDHLQALKDDGTNLASIVASSYFRYLPPAGLVPATSTTTFFSGHNQGPPQPVDGSIVRAVLQGASVYQTVDLNTTDKVWIYSVAQNQTALAQGAQPYFLFTTSQMPNAVPAAVSIPSTAPMIATGLVEKIDFSTANVPGGSTKGTASTTQATGFITHGLGPVAAAFVIGLEDFGSDPVLERKVDRYYAFRDTGISGTAYQIAAEVTNPFNGTFKIFATDRTLEFFDRLRWWAIRVP